MRLLTDQPATAEIGFTVARGSQGRGIASETVTAVLRRLFEEHHIHRSFAQTDDRNLAPHRLLERVGFRLEARLLEADWFKGKWTTSRTYAMLSREWTAVVQAAAPRRRLVHRGAMQDRRAG